MNWDAIRAAIESLVIRGKVIAAVVSGRTLLQVSGLAEDVYNNVELVMPYGVVGLPAAGSDIVILQIGAFGSHKIAFAGDNTADAVPGLMPGEVGFSRGGQLVLLKIGRTEIVTPLLQWGPSEAALKRLVQETFKELYNEHTHAIESGGETQPPSQQMDATHLTGGS